jgi:hypothetical protein
MPDYPDYPSCGQICPIFFADVVGVGGFQSVSSAGKASRSTLNQTQPHKNSTKAPPTYSILNRSWVHVMLGKRSAMMFQDNDDVDSE